MSYWKIWKIPHRRELPPAIRQENPFCKTRKNCTTKAAELVFKYIGLLSDGLRSIRFGKYGKIDAGERAAQDRQNRKKRKRKTSDFHQENSSK